MRFLLTYTILISSFLLAEEELLIWENTEGKTFEAELVWSDEKTVQLRGKQGNFYQFPLAHLSEKNFDYLKAWRVLRRKERVIFHWYLSEERYRTKKLSKVIAKIQGIYFVDGNQDKGTLSYVFRQIGEIPSNVLNREVFLVPPLGDGKHDGTDGLVKIVYGGQPVGTRKGLSRGKANRIKLNFSAFKDDDSVELKIICNSSNGFGVKTSSSGIKPRLIMVGDRPLNNFPD